MPVLLVSLGTSPAIVPEAFLLPGVEFTAVHVLTTESTSVDFILHWFAAAAPAVALTITRVARFTDFKTEREHFLFEEVLYRWWLEKCPGPEHPHVCLSGGFKTMSAAVQKAAAVLGAAEVFHVLCDLPGTQQPKTAEEIQAALADGHLHWIRLGAESGWPQLRQDQATDFPLIVDSTDGAVCSVSAPDFAFRVRLGEIVTRSHNIAGAWDQLAALPFSILATWTGVQLDWLGQPVDPESESDKAWVADLPKIELHCHLGGFATHGDHLRQVRESADAPGNLPPPDEPALPDGWPFPNEPIGLNAYMPLGNANGSKLLKDPGCLRRQCELLHQHLCEQNILYAEIRCSPNNYTSTGRSAWDVLSEIRETFQRCMMRKVAASVPLAEPVPATVPVADHLPGKFLPFQKDAGYCQTWRDLPHRHQKGTTGFVTFRLADSLPASALKQWIAERDHFLAAHPKPWTAEIWTRHQRQFPEKLEAWLDRSEGNCLLRNPDCADIVRNALHYFDGSRYILDHYVIMPNHVHVLVKPLGQHTLTDILHSWKSFTAKEINKLRQATGQVWEHESFDHLVRSGKQLEKLRAYIRDNPQTAGLTQDYVTGRGLGLEVELEPEPEPEPAIGTFASTTPTSGTLAATQINLIIIATRRDGGDRSDISRHLALAITAAQHWTAGCRVVGVDLAGWEKPETRAALFATDFEPVHRVGLAVTVHAGENDDAEGIWQAVFKLNARRLGHALHLMDAPDLLRAVAERRIGVEMCPFANLQIKGFQRKPGDGKPVYPLASYLHAGVPVTVNTDNIGISAASLTDNLLLAAELCPGLTRLDILQIQAHSLAAAFLPPSDRDVLRASMESQLTTP